MGLQIGCYESNSMIGHLKKSYLGGRKNKAKVVICKETTIISVN